MSGEAVVAQRGARWPLVLGPLGVVLGAASVAAIGITAPAGLVLSIAAFAPSRTWTWDAFVALAGILVSSFGVLVWVALMTAFYDPYLPAAHPGRDVALDAVAGFVLARVAFGVIRRINR